VIPGVVVEQVKTTLSDSVGLATSDVSVGISG